MQFTSIIRPPLSKRIKSGHVILQPGEDVGEHITEKREELIIVVKGRGTLIREGKKTSISENNAQYIGPEIKHNILNNSDSVLEYIYVVALLE